MTTPNLRWALCAIWILLAALTFWALDASSSRSWMYLATAALVPPLVLLSLWPDAPATTASDIMHGTDQRS